MRTRHKNKRCTFPKIRPFVHRATRVTFLLSGVCEIFVSFFFFLKCARVKKKINFPPAKKGGRRRSCVFSEGSVVTSSVFGFSVDGAGGVRLQLIWKFVPSRLVTANKCWCKKAICKLFVWCLHGDTQIHYGPHKTFGRFNLAVEFPNEPQVDKRRLHAILNLTFGSSVECSTIEHFLSTLSAFEVHPERSAETFSSSERAAPVLSAAAAVVPGRTADAPSSSTVAPAGTRPHR